MAERSWQLTVWLAEVVMRSEPPGEKTGCSITNFVDLLKANHSEAFLNKETNL